MNPKSGQRGRAPLVLFLWLYAQFRSFFMILFIEIFRIAQVFGVGDRYLPRVGIAVGMVFSVLCCITAARVETRRLQIVQIHGLMDKPEERVPMNVFLLLPQFIFLAGSDGLFYLASSILNIDQAPLTMMRHFTSFAHGFYGLGLLGSPLAVYAVGMISEKASGINWFESTLNKSRLDNYYWVLATFAALNLVVYTVMAVFRGYRESRLDQGMQLNIEVDDSGF